jgi:hypothetical protein
MIFICWSYTNGCLEHGSNGTPKFQNFQSVITSKEFSLLHCDEQIYMVLLSY